MNQYLIVLDLGSNLDESKLETLIIAYLGEHVERLQIRIKKLPTLKGLEIEELPCLYQG